MRAIVAGLAAFAVLAGSTHAEQGPVCADCVLGHIAHLAAPDLKGRLCATDGETRAADYVAGQLKATGVASAAASGFVQAVALGGVQYAAPPRLSIGGLSFRYGEAFIAFGLLAPTQGRLVRVTDAADPPADIDGAIVFYDPPGGADPRAANDLLDAGAASVMVSAPASLAPHWDAIAGRLPGRVVAGLDDPSSASDRPPVILLKPQAARALRALPPGATARLEVETASYAGATHNIVGVIHGSAPDADHHAILLSAHYDHLGLAGGQLYPGANDDASGTAAVLEFARLLAKGPPPRRTVYFAFFGCEEEGGYGAAYFRAHPPGGRLEDLAANLEFEMIGFPDPKRPNALMFTGWERSNLGPTLAAHGAKIGPDLYPEQNFFRRSDNYALAEKGVVAHTISAWPTPPTYHRPTDTFASLDKAFLIDVIDSLVEPVRWLANTDFTPAWNEGGRP